MKHLANAGLISMGGYLPAKPVPSEKASALADFLRKETLLPPEYIAPIENDALLPGRVETNWDGWESQPWYESWLAQLPPKKRENPFQGAVERRRVPMDPESVRNSVRPHPMLSSDAETLAAGMAIFNAGIDKNEIDLVLCSSLVPDLHVPQNASLVQHKLGLEHAGAYNVDTCCSSFITMMEVAMTYVRMGLKKKVLVVGSSLDSIINDKSTYYSVYIGDGAMAGIVGEVEEGYGYIASHSHSIGRRHKAIVFAEREPALYKTTSQGPSHVQEYVTFLDKDMQKEIAKETQNDIIRVTDGMFAKTSYGRKDIDFLITHQPVPWTPESWRQCLDVPKDRIHDTWAKYGNIAVASSAVNHLEAIEEGKMKAGDKCLIVSSGVGENHICLFHRISPTLVENLRL
ncbi:MAG: 3-oxoacyl-ACP synthase III family protein [Spirochaetales bacterium]|nr:3-oxoacyl-ACP synthase III family protein [Spirochaetales bacterium]